MCPGSQKSPSGVARSVLYVVPAFALWAFGAFTPLLSLSRNGVI